MHAAIGFAAVCAFCVVPVLSAAEIETAERVLIKKSERKLYLYKGETVLRAMDIALGLVPVGDKQSEGDFRTPEGDYLLTERNPASDFFLSILISYPNSRPDHGARPAERTETLG
jgi:murein L,D-transpeptidase YafK